MTINKTESIFTDLYFKSDYTRVPSLYKNINNTLYLSSKRDYDLSDDPFNYVTAITKFNIPYQNDDWDRRVFQEIQKSEVSNLYALMVWW